MTILKTQKIVFFCENNFQRYTDNQNDICTILWYYVVVKNVSVYIAAWIPYADFDELEFCRVSKIV